MIIISYTQKMFLPLPLQPPDASLSSIEFENHMIRFYGLLHSLTHIGERARETRALTLAGRQDDAELMTVQVVLQKLTENACSLVRTQPVFAADNFILLHALIKYH